MTNSCIDYILVICGDLLETLILFAAAIDFKLFVVKQYSMFFFASLMPNNLRVTKLSTIYLLILGLAAVSWLSEILIYSLFYSTGMVGWCGVVAYGLYGIKKRKQPLGIHLIHTRVIAQACVVGMLSFGVGYQIITEHIVPWYKNKFSSDAPPQ
jgi:hypothetical protein